MLHGHRTPVLHRATLTLLLILAAAPALGRWVALDESPAGQTPQVTVRAQGADAWQVTVAVPGVWLTQEEQGGATGSAVTMPGCVPMLEADHPELPLLARALPLPATGTPELTIIAERWRRVSAPAPLPSAGPLSRDQDPASAPRRFGAVYRAGAVWPAEAARLGRPFLVRDRRGVALRIHPVRWDAAAGELLVLEEMTLQVAAGGAGGINVATAPVAAAPRAFGPVYRKLFGDHAPRPAGTVRDRSDHGGSEADKGEDLADVGNGHGASERLLIITTAGLQSAAAPLADWKRACGHDVEIVTMAGLGGTVLGIHHAIEERFVAPVGLAHVLLLGDVEQVPTNTGSYNGADSDGLYGLRAGDDLYVDVLVSRLPARNVDEARLMIDRTVAYERDPQPGAGWYTAAVGIASDEGTPADYERAEWLRDDLLAASYTDVGRIYQGFGGDRGAIAAAVDGGAGLINYLGHGSGTGWLSVPFDNADVHALGNTTAWPWIIDVSCSNGDFSRPECFAEAWLRASHDGAPAGAVAMISASNLTSWVPPCVMQETMVDHLTGEVTAELGALYAAGVAEVLVQYGGTTQARKLMEQYNLFGDGSLRVRSRAPVTLTVTHGPQIAPDASTFAVTAPGGARVVLTDPAGVVARAVADADGLAALVPRRALSAGEILQLTVTAVDAVPYRAELPVQASPVAAADTLPDAAALLGNWPNPFNPATTVGFSLPQTGPVRLTVHDVRGRLVRVLRDETLGAGNHQVRWNGLDGGGRAVASGLYLVQLQTTSDREVRKMTLAR